MADERHSIDARSPAKLSMSSTRSHNTQTDEEALPLYESFQEAEKDSTNNTDTLPDPKASPDAVRDYLTTLLTEKRNLQIDHVRRVVSKWTVGTGQELRSYPPAMYLNLFGREDGWMVYKEVKLIILRAKAKKDNDGNGKEGDKPTSKWSIFATLVVVCGIDIVLWTLFFKNSHGYVQIPAIIGALVFALFGIVTLCVLCDSPRSEEKMVKEIEEELQECVNAKSGSES